MYKVLSKLDDSQNTSIKQKFHDKQEQNLHVNLTKISAGTKLVLVAKGFDSEV